MSEPTTLADLIGDAPLPTDKVRKCKHCAQVKPFTPEHWVCDKGKPRGWRCKACDSARSSRKARRKTEVAEALRLAARTGQAATSGGRPATPDIPATMAGARNMVARQLDATEALRAGVKQVNNHAARVLAKVFEYAMDPVSPHHEWALKMVAERVMPAKMFAELGLAGAGLAGKGGNAAGPTVQIMVMPAAPAPQAVPAAVTVRAIENGASDDDGQAAG